MRNSDVVEAFMHRRECLNTRGNLHCTGTRLISYNVCIAEWVGYILLFNSDRYSVTTSKHQYLVRRRLSEAWKSVQVPGIPRGTDRLSGSEIAIRFFKSRNTTNYVQI